MTILVVWLASYIWHTATADQEPGDNEQIHGLMVLESHSKNTLETWTKQNTPGFSQAHLAYKYMGFRALIFIQSQAATSAHHVPWMDTRSTPVS